MIHDILEWERSLSPREYAELERALYIMSSSAIRSSSSPQSKYELDFAKAPLSDSVNSFIVTRPSLFNLSLTNKPSLAHHGPEASSSPPPANVMTEAPVETTTSATKAPTTTTTPQTNMIHPGRANISQVNQDIAFIPTAAEIAYMKMLEEIALTKRLEEENLVRTRRHSSSLASRRFPVPRCSCMGYYHCRTRLGCPKAPE